MGPSIKSAIVFEYLFRASVPTATLERESFNGVLDFRDCIGQEINVVIPNS